MATSSIEELDVQSTKLGELVLRRRRSPSTPDEPVYEVTIDHEMLMSSTVNASERALADLALELLNDRPCTVLVGGLGLGYTAAAALAHDNVKRLEVVEMLAPVIDWHRRRLVPLAGVLIDDPRFSLIAGDFFDGIESQAANRWDAVLLDIDHAPDCWLDDRHRGFYTETSLRKVAGCLRPGGVFALWSAWAPKREFVDLLNAVFTTVSCHEVTFFNPHVNERDSNWVVVAGTGHDRRRRMRSVR